MNLFKKVSTRNGERVESKKWYVSIDRKHIPLHPDKKVARELALQLLGKKAAGTLGVIVHKGGGESALILPLVDEWKASLLSKGTGEAHANQTVARVVKVVKGCGFERLRDLDGDKGRKFIDALTGGRGGVADRPASAQTKLFHLKAVRQFAHWLVKKKAIGSNPFTGVDGWDVKADRRHDRRELTDNELGTLLSTTEGQGVDRWDLNSADRVMLYRVALSTGYRAKELAAMTPDNVDLTAGVITLAGRYTKNGEDACQPITPDLHTTLAPWLKQRAKDVPLWPGAWAKTFAAGKMLRKDLEAAGVAYKTDAGFADFHSLRHTYISRLIRCGVNLKVAATLARHGTVSLTADRYGHLAHGEKRAAVSGFTIPGCKSDANTGGDGSEGTGFSGRRRGRHGSTEPKVEGSNPSGCTQANRLGTAEQHTFFSSPRWELNAPRDNLKGTTLMPTGRQPVANLPALSNITAAFLCAWPNVSEHIRLAIPSLIEPHLPSSRG